MFFFFKQKTAYEMRISDWSSDVCSSDLGREHLAKTVRKAAGGRGQAPQADPRHDRIAPPAKVDPPPKGKGETDVTGRKGSAGQQADLAVGQPQVGADRVDQQRQHEPVEKGQPARQHQRSEEHTSELQSLMRISYAVFCLKTNTET